MTFVKGQSGNPAGRPRGSRNRAALALEPQMEAFGEELARQAIELARSGNIAALRLCLDRVMPRGRGRPVCFAMPKLESAADVRAASTAVATAMAAGEMSPAEAMDVLRAIDQVVNLLRKADAMEEAEARRAAASGPEVHPVGAEASGRVVESSEIQAARPNGDGAETPPPGRKTGEPGRAAPAETTKMQAGAFADPAMPAEGTGSRGAQAGPDSAAPERTGKIQAGNPPHSWTWPLGASAGRPADPAKPAAAIVTTGRIQADRPSGRARRSERWVEAHMPGSVASAALIAAAGHAFAGR
jgi:hypothetical protein